MTVSGTPVAARRRRGRDRRLRVVIGTGDGARAEDDEDERARHQVLPQPPEGPRPAQATASGIEYRERSPLVLPPSTRPAAAGSRHEPADKTAAWPIDPDVKRAKERKEAGQEAAARDD